MPLRIEFPRCKRSIEQRSSPHSMAAQRFAIRTCRPKRPLLHRSDSDSNVIQPTVQHRKSANGSFAIRRADYYHLVIQTARTLAAKATFGLKLDAGGQCY